MIPLKRLLLEKMAMWWVPGGESRLFYHEFNLLKAGFYSSPLDAPTT
ncbi:hypothetical protein ACVXHB_17250 [Escherichia coli]